ncbi:hypothetical protein C8R44DRAFT_731225 [Mycena epipterygia]|nr:hypothetical protein C8R44DRAFT_731225 [Mycena epipterygia]
MGWKTNPRWGGTQARSNRDGRRRRGHLRNCGADRYNRGTHIDRQCHVEGKEKGGGLEIWGKGGGTESSYEIQGAQGAKEGAARMEELPSREGGREHRRNEAVRTEHALLMRLAGLRSGRASSSGGGKMNNGTKVEVRMRDTIEWESTHTHDIQRVGSPELTERRRSSAARLEDG